MDSLLKLAAENAQTEISEELVSDAGKLAEQFELSIAGNQRKFALELSESIVLKLGDREIVIGAVLDKIGNDDKEMMVA